MLLLIILLKKLRNEKEKFRVSQRSILSTIGSLKYYWILQIERPCALDSLEKTQKLERKY